MTKIEKYEILKALVTGAELEVEMTEELTAEIVEMIEHEVGAIAKRNATPRKDSAEKRANAEAREAIYTALAGCGERMTIAEYIEKYEPTRSVSSVKAFMSQLVSEGRVERIKEKGKTYFKAIVAE